MDAVIGSLGTKAGAYEANLAAGGWPNTSGHEDYAQLRPSRIAAAREYHQGFILTLAYLAANPTSKVHSHTLTADVQAANPSCGFEVSETAVISAALSTTAGYRGASGTTKAYVVRESDGDRVWEDVPGIWLSQP